MKSIKLDLRRIAAAIMACVLVGAAMPAAAVVRVQVAAPTGLWVNPARSVKVATAPCGAALCGRVAWASGAASTDARAGGTPRLAGTEILQDYHRAGAATWQGRVLVPDMGRTVDSTLTLLDTDRLKVSGCVLGGLFCKSQIWTRVEQP